MISQLTPWPSKLIDGWSRKTMEFVNLTETHTHTHWIFNSIYQNDLHSGKLGLNWLSLVFFKRDIGKVIEALYGESPPPIMIIGHSMGGAIAVHTAVANHLPSLLGLCVIDVVEGNLCNVQI